jgi:hypothetical protein
MAAVTASTTSTQPLANTSTQPLAKSQSAAPAQPGPAGAAAPVKPAVSPGIAAAPSVCTAWDDMDSAARDDKAPLTLDSIWRDRRLDPTADIALKPNDEEAEKKLLSAIAASSFSADDIRKHFANSDPATQARVDSILKGTPIEVLQAARLQTSASRTKSDSRQWQALDRAVTNVLAASHAGNAYLQAKNWHDPQEVALFQKAAEYEKAEKDLASAILASPFSAGDIRNYVTGDTAATTAAVETALGGNAFGEPVSPGQSRR